MFIFTLKNNKQSSLIQILFIVIEQMYYLFYRQLYCGNQFDGLYDCEAKENVNSNYLNIKKHDVNSISAKDDDVNDEKIFIFNSNVDYVNNSRDRRKLYNNIQIRRTEEECDNSIADNLDWKGKAIKESPVWCMDFCNDLIIIGCADGRLEFWEASSGKLMVSIHFIIHIHTSHNLCNIWNFSIKTIVM